MLIRTLEKSYSVLLVILGYMIDLYTIYVHECCVVLALLRSMFGSYMYPSIMYSYAYRLSIKNHEFVTHCCSV